MRANICGVIPEGKKGGPMERTALIDKIYG